MKKIIILIFVFITACFLVSCKPGVVPTDIQVEEFIDVLEIPEKPIFKAEVKSTKTTKSNNSKEVEKLDYYIYANIPYEISVRNVNEYSKKSKHTDQTTKTEILTAVDGKNTYYDGPGYDKKIFPIDTFPVSGLLPSIEFEDEQDFFNYKNLFKLDFVKVRLTKNKLSATIHINKNMINDPKVKEALQWLQLSIDNANTFVEMNVKIELTKKGNNLKKSFLSVETIDKINSSYKNDVQTITSKMVYKQEIVDKYKSLVNKASFTYYADESNFGGN